MNTDKTYAEKIAAEYAPKETSKVLALRKLDRRAKLPANVLSYALGIITSLVMGAGMCLSMGVIGDKSVMIMTLGITMGIVGIIGMSINYPIYRRMVASGKQRYAADIMRLADEISQEDASRR